MSLAESGLEFDPELGATENRKSFHSSMGVSIYILSLIYSCTSPSLPAEQGCLTLQITHPIHLKWSLSQKGSSRYVEVDLKNCGKQFLSSRRCWIWNWDALVGGFLRPSSTICATVHPNSFAFEQLRNESSGNS